jgi:hypothetical protein
MEKENIERTNLASLNKKRVYLHIGILFGTTENRTDDNPLNYECMIKPKASLIPSLLAFFPAFSLSRSVSRSFHFL